MRTFVPVNAAIMNLHPTSDLELGRRPDTDTYLAWLGQAGLEPLWHRYVAEGASGHTLVLAQRH